MSRENHLPIESPTTKSTGEMSGGIFVGCIYERLFKANAVYLENLSTLIQIYGIEKPETPESSVILLQLKPGTGSGLYQFDAEEVIYLGYYPPISEGHYETTGGAFLIYFDSERKAVHGRFLFKCKQGTIEKEVDVDFNIKNV
ncbi:hypothetical protein HKK55_10765 [Pseudomonas sp. ADAK18]|uniref:hypothetical protein n=1 Tax=Pseudomonas sp. ADAK18 TaxID=2730848 RepID=UPI001463C004|nr:hypothetical protein [Pseudomonas sp. ADAK18]QJI29171.1 hypothetical protein HKK55_10765 [Pseudomonas sp. ADAK18]